MLFSARETCARRTSPSAQPTRSPRHAASSRDVTWRLGTRQTRRRIRANHGRFIDSRATLRGSLRHGGMPIELRPGERSEIRTRPLVVICDISGSMDRYARLLLRFVHALGKVWKTPRSSSSAPASPASPASCASETSIPRIDAGRRFGRGLVRRHAHRRGNQDVQLPVGAASSAPERPSWCISDGWDRAIPSCSAARWPGCSAPAAG